MVATTLVLLCTRPPIAALARVGPWLLPLPAIAIIGREVLLSIVTSLFCFSYCAIRKLTGITCSLLPQVNAPLCYADYHVCTARMGCFSGRGHSQGYRVFLTIDSYTLLLFSCLIKGRDCRAFSKLGKKCICRLWR